jgi:hypothetical protein
MPDHADFLDHTGRTPREYGAVHIHAEPVVRGPSGNAVATVWLQSAFEPLLTTDSLHIVARLAQSQGELSLKRLPLPSLAGGKVVRWRLPLSLQVDVAELLFLVESKLHPKAQRVRPAWKLFDTIEVPNESELQNSLADPLSSIALNIAGAAALTVLAGGGGAGAARSIRSAVSMLSDAGKTALSEKTHAAGAAPLTVHAARAQPPGFISQVTQGVPEPLHEPRLEVLWEPGQPLPEAFQVPLPTPRKEEPAARADQGRMRTCYTCGFEGLTSDYERAVSCPRCDASWY